MSKPYRERWWALFAVIILVFPAFVWNAAEDALRMLDEIEEEYRLSQKK